MAKKKYDQVVEAIAGTPVLNSTGEEIVETMTMDEAIAEVKELIEEAPEKIEEAIKEVVEATGEVIDVVAPIIEAAVPASVPVVEAVKVTQKVAEKIIAPEEEKFLTPTYKTQSVIHSNFTV